MPNEKRPATSRPPAPPNPSDESEPASSAASSAASGTSSDGFIDNGGPAFDPEAAAGAPPAIKPDEVLPPEQEWELATIESLLSIKGRALHAMIGVAEEDWKYTQLDLEAIGPPAQRILNRYDATRALAAHADPLVLAAAFGAYVVRSAEERASVLRAMAQDEPVPIEPLPEQPINAAPAAPVPPTGPPPVAPPLQADIDVAEAEWSTPSQAR